MTYSTYKRKFKPILYEVRDSKAWVKETMEPTMRNAGFKWFTHYFDDDMKPKKLVLSLIKPEKHEMVVYSVWKHQCGYSKCIYVFYK